MTVFLSSRWRLRLGALLEFIEMLGFKRALFGWEVQRAFHRYLGDYTLFMSGLFRPFVERDGYLGWYLSEGARTYACVAEPAGGRAENGSSTKSSPPASSTTLARSTTCARSASPVFSGPDPIGAFLREIGGVVDGPSRNQNLFHLAALVARPDATSWPVAHPQDRSRSLSGRLGSNPELSEACSCAQVVTGRGRVACLCKCAPASESIRGGRRARET